MRAVTPWRDEHSEEAHNAVVGACPTKSRRICAGFPPQTDRNDRAKRYLKSTINNRKSTIGSGFAGLGARCLFEIARIDIAPSAVLIDEQVFEGRLLVCGKDISHLRKYIPYTLDLFFRLVCRPWAFR